MEEKVAALQRLQEIVDVLRGPNGCPWDRAQTLTHMSRYVEEEAFEVVDALEGSGGKPTPQLCEELGDLLMNVLLAAKISEDEGAFSIADVARGIAEKLVRRHPHVFADRPVSGVDEVLTNWNAIKAAEKAVTGGAAAGGTAGRPPSRLDGVPRSLPPLERAYELGRKAAKAGFDWPDPSGAFEKVSEELEEVRRALPGDRSRLEGELGDLLLAAVNLCRKLDVRPSAALRGALGRFCDRFRRVEERLPELEQATLDEMEAVWQAAKSVPPERGEDVP
ncbi:MAG: nucleoside triphosphate pyrophosphohydrolase [Planctomycetes bacterium]|nr:nucleoside triphosphate pyrophosphohydrolase [Planctomycetota bacterium]